MHFHWQYEELAVVSKPTKPTLVVQNTYKHEIFSFKKLAEKKDEKLQSSKIHWFSPKQVFSRIIKIINLQLKKQVILQLLFGKPIELVFSDTMS